LKLHFEVLSDSEVQKVHDASLRVLERTGMRFASGAALERLAAEGAKVDFGEHTARFPRRIVEESIASNQKALNCRSQ
jgi:trimethylamine--corrinoid protein Co-methyltransferase